MDVPLESSSDSAWGDEEPKIEAEEHAGSGVGTGESEEPRVEVIKHARSGIGDGEPVDPKVEIEDVSVEDIDVLQGSSSNSMGEEEDPEEAGALRWSLRKKRGPVVGKVRHSSEEYDNETEETGDPRWQAMKKPVPAARSGRRCRMSRRRLIPAVGRMSRRGRRGRMRRRGLIPVGGRGRRRPVSSREDEEEHTGDLFEPVTCRICSMTCPTLRKQKGGAQQGHFPLQQLLPGPCSTTLGTSRPVP